MQTPVAGRKRTVSDCRSKLTEEKFHNWIKAQLALLYTKEGVKSIVIEKTTTCHQAILNAILTQDQIKNRSFCNGCCLQNILTCPTRGICSFQGSCPFHQSQKYRYCPKNVCDRFRDKIIKEHVEKSPSWRNTYPERWCEDPWEMVKCFMPPDGYVNANTFQKTDFHGIVNVMINHKDIAKCVPKDTCSEVRQMSNEIRHSPEQNIETTQLHVYIDKLVQFLSQTCFRTIVGAVEAITKLTELKNNTLYISSSEVAQSIPLEHEDAELLRHIKEKLKSQDEKHSKDLGNILALSELVAKKSKLNDYAQLEKDLVDDLRSFYNHEYKNILVSPLLSESDVDILQFYVHPKMMRMEWGANETTSKIQVQAYQDVIGTSANIYSDVYISAQAGTGKTTFVKRMCTVWCLSKGAEKTDVTDTFKRDVETISQFDFLFFILLRDTHSLDVDEMIRNHVITNLSRANNYDTEFLDHVLHKRRCLVILDGLDEWRPEACVPEDVKPMPHSRTREKCTILTTTRPWKMYERDIRKSKVSNYIELTFDKNSTNSLIPKVIGTLIKVENENEIQKQAREFKKMIKENDLFELIYTPVILIEVICLWHDKRKLGQTKCEIYSNIVDFMLEMDHANPKSIVYHTVDNVQMPSCFEENDLCKTYYPLLLAVGNLAYTTLFKSREASALVFEKKVVQNALITDAIVQCCLRMGLLSESKDRNKLAKRKLHYFFIHKTFQEFFCSLHMQGIETDEITIKNVCISIAGILDMSHVFIFLAGLNREKATQISKTLIDILEQDPETGKYRRRVCTAIGWSVRFKVFKDFQNMLMECIKEDKNSENSTNGFHLHDLVLDENCKGSYKKDLKSLIEFNRDNLKSIRIYDCGSAEIKHAYITHFRLNDIESLEKIEIIGHLDHEDIDSLIRKSLGTLKCLSLCVDRRRDKNWKKSFTHLTTNCVERIKVMNNLVALMLECFSISHCDLESLITFLSNRKDMVQINLAFITCIDHKDECTGFNLNLSSHQLDMLQLGNIAISSLSLNPDTITMCRIGSLKPEVLTTLLNSFKHSKLLRSFMCFDSKSSAETGRVLSFMPNLQELQTLVLKKIHISDDQKSQIKVPPNVKHIKLVEVKMSKDVFECLFGEIRSTTMKNVRLELVDCKIGSPEDYESLKKAIASSANYDVWSSDELEESGDVFMFTVKRHN